MKERNAQTVDGMVGIDAVTAKISGILDGEEAAARP